MEQTRCLGCMKQKYSRPVCEICGYDEYDAGTANNPNQLPAGTVLRSQYMVGRVLGQGGFGITYLGWDRNLETKVAIKEYYPTGAVSRECTVSLAVRENSGQMGLVFRNNKERFIREAKMLARLSGLPGIVQVRNFFQENNTAYIVMEFVEGTTLRQHVLNRGGRLSAQETLSILRPVMEALQRVHGEGLIHRDISPDNIMLLPHGGTKLIDFGAVRDTSDADAENPLPRSTEAILKHGFAPIEQYQRRGSLGPWSDVYALCATAYYCLTGNVPPDAPERLLNEENDINWYRVPGLAPHQAAAFARGMALLPKNRISSVRELSDSLFPQPRQRNDCFAGYQNDSYGLPNRESPYGYDPEPQLEETVPIRRYGRQSYCNPQDYDPEPQLEETVPIRRYGYHSSAVQGYGLEETAPLRSFSSYTPIPKQPDAPYQLEDTAPIRHYGYQSSQVNQDYDPEPILEETVPVRRYGAPSRPAYQYHYAGSQDPTAFSGYYKIQTNDQFQQSSQAASEKKKK